MNSHVACFAAAFLVAACSAESRDLSGSSTEGTGGHGGAPTGTGGTGGVGGAGGAGGLQGTGGVAGSGSGAGGIGTGGTAGAGGTGGGFIEGHCRGDADCGTGACVAPDEPAPCQGCVDPASSCVDDDDCIPGSGFICEPAPCPCTTGIKTCLIGCQSSADCPSWKFCAPTHRCVAEVCVNDAGCPEDFDCLPPSNPHCTRTSCADDTGCVGFCVEDFCYDKLGECAPLP